MIPNHSNCYAVLPNDMEGERLDFVFHHPAMEEVREFRRAHTSRLGEEITGPQYGESLSGRLEGNVGFINVQHLTNKGEIYFDNATFVEDYDGDKLLAPGDILIARSGSVGRVALVTREFADYAFGSFCIRFRLTPDSALQPEFVVQFLNSRFGQSQIELLKTGSIQMNINSGQIEDIAIVHLAPARQEAIVTATKAIEFEARQLNIAAAKIRQAAADILPDELNLSFSATDEIRYFFKTGEEKASLAFCVGADELSDRMQYLFFHPRYRVLEELKDKFTCTSIKNIVSVPVRRGEQPEYEEAGEVMVLKTVDLKNGSIDYDAALRVSREFYENKPTAQIQHGDVLIASTGYGSLGKVDVYEAQEEALVDGHVSILRPTAHYDAYFLTYFLRSYLGQLQIEKWFSGSSGQIELQPSDIHKIFIPTADENGIDLEEQKRIAELITKRLEEAQSLEAQAAAKWAEARETFERMLFEDSD